MCPIKVIWKEILTDLGLEKFEAKFEENGFDNHEFFPQIQRGDLKNMGFKLVDIKSR